MSFPEEFVDAARREGDKGAGLRLLGSLGFEVSPYRVVEVAAFQDNRAELDSCRCAALPPALARRIAEAYASLVRAEAGSGLVLVRGSLDVRRSPCGLTYSAMVENAEEALEAARVVYQRFFEASPAFTDREGVALILQAPTFHRTEVNERLLSGNLAVRQDCTVVEICEGKDLRRAAKWWNGTVGGFVTWAMDVAGDASRAYWIHKDRAETGVIDLAPGGDDAQAPPFVARNRRALRGIVESGRHIRSAVGFDVDLEWVRTDRRLYYHQLRPLLHRFTTCRDPARLVSASGLAVTSAVALRNGGAAGHLYRPRAATSSSPWLHGPAAGPFLLVSSVSKGSLPTDFQASSGCVGIVDPTLGSRLSHFAANWGLPYIAVPGLDRIGVPGHPSDGGWQSDEVWEIQASAR